MYDKLDKTVFISRKKKSKNIDGDYDEVNLFNNVNDEFETISEIISSTSNWEEVK
jgi:hypothetical protein